MWGKGKSAAAKSSPHAKAVIWVPVKHTGTNAGISAADVILNGPTPGQGVTDASGLVKFEGRTPGDYTFNIG
jgi:hypothetical protein